MPKEVIYADGSVVSTGGKPVVEVGWHRDQGVQVATKCLSDLGGRLSDYEGVHYTDGFWVDLNRREINELIRHLRRARDQAFGRDTSPR